MAKLCCWLCGPVRSSSVDWGDNPSPSRRSPPAVRNWQPLLNQLPAAGTFRPLQHNNCHHRYLARSFWTQWGLCALETSLAEREQEPENWQQWPTGRGRCDKNKKEGGRRWRRGSAGGREPFLTSVTLQSTGAAGKELCCPMIGSALMAVFCCPGPTACCGNTKQQTVA